MKMQTYWAPQACFARSGEEGDNQMFFGAPPEICRVPHDVEVAFDNYIVVGLTRVCKLGMMNRY